MNAADYNLAMPSERIEIHLRYEGPDVADGSLSVDDIVPVLQGFSSAYGKLAAIDSPGSTHRIRVTGVHPGSADIVLDIWNSLKDMADPLASGAILTQVGYKIVQKIAGVISAKRHTKKEPFSHSISATNSIVLVNSQNVSLELPLEIFETFRKGEIDADLNKIVSPLTEDKIEAVELTATSDRDEIRERITIHERPYFDVEQRSVAQTTETKLTVRLNSVVKSTNSGHLYLSNGNRVHYQYTGDNPTKLYSLIAHDGPVEIRCIAQMDENLEVMRVEISEIDIIQGDLFSSGRKTGKRA